MDALVRFQICPATQGYVLNSWYVIAFSHEVTSEKPLARRCCDDPIVLYRTSQGQAVALHDRCTHRGVPLSFGKVVGDALECVYHGAQFGASGQCIRIPSQETIPSAACVQSYPLIERGGFIWLWRGDAARADAALLPDHHALGLGREGWSSKPYFVLEIKSNYSMLFENLLDTSHISFLHGTALDSGRMATASFRSESDASSVKLIRTLKGDIANPNNAKQYGLKPGMTFDRELTSAALLPNMHIIRNVFTFPDNPNAPEHIRINVMPITPAGPGLHYHFLTMTASYPEEHPPQLIEAMRTVLNQDKVVLEATQALFDELGPDAPEFSVKADEGALKGRRTLAAMVRADAGLELTQTCR